MTLALIVSMAILTSSVIAQVRFTIIIVDFAPLASKPSNAAALKMTVKISTRSPISTRVSQFRTLVNVNFTVPSTPT